MAIPPFRPSGKRVHPPEIKANFMCVCPCVVVMWEVENRVDATQCFTELVVCSTCFGHVYAHHQELATIQLVWHVACKFLVAGSWKAMCRAAGYASEMRDAVRLCRSINIV